MRVKSGTRTRRRHKKVLGLAKGYWMSRSKQFKKAQEAVLHAGEYAFHGRKRTKREFRTLWIKRLNNAVSEQDMRYSTFINSLKKKNIELDRKVLAQIAVEHPQVFKKIVDSVKN